MQLLSMLNMREKKYDQVMPQSQTTDQPIATAPRRRDIEH